MGSKRTRKSRKPRKQHDPSRHLSPSDEKKSGILQWVILSGVLAVLLLRPIVDGKTFPISNLYFQLAIYALSFLWAASLFFRKERKISSPLPTLLLLLFLLIGMVGLKYSVSPADTWLGILELGSYVALWILLANLDYTRDQLFGLLLVIFLACASLMAHGLYQYFVFFSDTRWFVLNYPEEAQKLLATLDNPAARHRLTSNRVFATFLHPNSLGGYLDMVIPIALSALIVLVQPLWERIGKKKNSPGSVEDRPLEGSRNMRVLAVALLAVLCAAQGMVLFLTYSRGSWLALIAAVAAWLILLFFARKAGVRALWKVWPIALVAVGLLMGAAAWNSRIGDRPAPSLTYLHGDLPQPGTAQGDEFMRGHDPGLSEIASSVTFKLRLTYWEGALKIIRDHWLLGTGWDTWGAMYPQHMHDGSYPTKYAHNNYLQIWCEMGVIGLALFLGFLGVLGVQIFRRIRSGKVENTKAILAVGCVAGAVGFLAHSVIDFDLYVPGLGFYFFAMAGLAAGLVRSRQDIRLPRWAGVAGMAFAIVMASATLPPLLANKAAGGITFGLQQGNLLDKQILIAQTMIGEQSVSNQTFEDVFVPLGERSGGPYTRQEAAGRMAGIFKEWRERFERAQEIFRYEASYFYFSGYMNSLLDMLEGKSGTDLDRAIDDFRQATQLRPVDSSYHFMLAMALWRKGAGTSDRTVIDEALQEYTRAIELYPVDPKNHIAIATVYEKLQMKELAEKHRRRAEELRRVREAI